MYTYVIVLLIPTYTYISMEPMKTQCTHIMIPVKANEPLNQIKPGMKLSYLTSSPPYINAWSSCGDIFMSRVNEKQLFTKACEPRGDNILKNYTLEKFFKSNLVFLCGGVGDIKINGLHNRNMYCKENTRAKVREQKVGQSFSGKHWQSILYWGDYLFTNRNSQVKLVADKFWEFSGKIKGER